MCCSDRTTVHTYGTDGISHYTNMKYALILGLLESKLRHSETNVCNIHSILVAKCELDFNII